MKDGHNRQAAMGNFLIIALAYIAIVLVFHWYETGNIFP